MVGRWAWMALGLLGLGACTEQFDSRPGVPGAAEVGLGQVDAAYQRGIEQAFTERPFARGPMAVLAEEGGRLSTYTLVPCGGGATVCLGSDRGPAGQLSRTPDWWVVRGLAGRTFWLSYGGDGYLERNGTYVPLAWNARPNGTGVGTQPVLETPYPHGT